jgi:arginyl-tRNA synthetase
MILEELKLKITDLVRQSIGDEQAGVEVVFAPDSKLGDLTTNAALVAAKKTGKTPRDLASEIAKMLSSLEEVLEATVAGPGFVNIRLADSVLAELAGTAPSERPDSYAGLEVVTEYSDPNPFKVLHVGHLYTSIIGESISTLIAAAGGKVHRVNFGGDVGLHVGRTLWGMLKELGGEQPEGLKKVPKTERPLWMAKAYVMGTQAYEEDEKARVEIIDLNKRVYEIHERDDRQSNLAKIYWECRQWSYEYFEEFYQRLGLKFEKYYPESQTSPVGLETVREELKKGVYEESDGAVVFRGEPYGLHTRVFITSSGLPTYEAKDVGLIMAKWRDFHFDRSVIITGSDITEYMKVVLKSIEQFEPELVERTTHITHGNVKLAGGVKMSSRKGNFLMADDVIEEVAKASRAATGKDDREVVLGALKYAFLKQRIGPDVVFVAEESVTIEGNSGPYLQYAHARARSILAKAKAKAKAKGSQLGDRFEPAERELAWKVSQYPDVVRRSVAELMPHHICGYLYELAQGFNRFYEANRVVGSEREVARLKLVELYADVLADGLGLLGIVAPERL